MRICTKADALARGRKDHQLHRIVIATSIRRLSPYMPTVATSRIFINSESYHASPRSLSVTSYVVHIVENISKTDSELQYRATLKVSVKFV